jgi:hypothetical protein
MKTILGIFNIFKINIRKGVLTGSIHQKMHIFSIFSILSHKISSNIR